MTQEQNNEQVDDKSTEQDSQSQDRGGEQLRNLSDLKQAISKRDEYKNKYSEASEQLSELEARVKDYEQRIKEQEGQYKPLFEELRTELDQAKSENSQLLNKITEFETQQRQTQFTVNALEGATNKEKAETLLHGLMAQGKVDLNAEDVSSEVEKARELLAQVDKNIYSNDKTSRIPENIPGGGIRREQTSSGRKTSFVPLYQQIEARKKR